MKPSLEEVLEKILQLYHMQGAGRKKLIRIKTITQELDTCYDNVLPSLLQLSRENRIKFADANRQTINVVGRNIAA